MTSIGNPLRFLVFFFLLGLGVQAQNNTDSLTSPLLVTSEEFTRADTLRGSLGPERTCFDVRFYHLDVKVDPEKHFIEGSNTITFTVKEPSDRIQLDLFPQLTVQEVLDENGQSLPVEREEYAFFVNFTSALRVGDTRKIKVNYAGPPKVALKPPWDGGVGWNQDEEGNPWVTVTCQGLGASVWWPNKDHQSDEPDSMLISITVPSALKNISNGRLRNVEKIDDHWTRYDWFVGNPINNYNVTMNIGNYTHFKEEYTRGQESLSLDYYVLPYHLKEAKRQFEQVKPMLECFESYFGPYPFPEDGYKLVESPHPGMEHQSAVAYGNYFQNGYRLRASSRVGLWFDFIIIHETAHEWFGNSITSADVADMWIHESFGAYAEAIYAECRFGYEAAMEYMRGKKYEVKLDKPVQGPYGVNQPGSGDMYPKGALMLNTLRHACGSDEKWFAMLRQMNTTFRHCIVDYTTITQFMNRTLGRDFTHVFAQYLQKTALPVFKAQIEVKGEEQILVYAWEAEVEHFDMPVTIKVGDDQWKMVYPTREPQSISLQLSDPNTFQVDDNYYVETKLKVNYLLSEFK